MQTIIIILAGVTIIVLLLLLAQKKAVSLTVGDPNWNGKLEGKTPEYQGPAYLYSDGRECLGVRFNVPIIGYRIAPDLIIYHFYGYDVAKDEILGFARSHHAHPISTKDIPQLLENWDKLNELKKIVYDDLLPYDDFWVDTGHNFEIYSLKTHSILSEDRRNLNKQYANVILKIER
ncbi:MAG TPA: hypothetical protein DIC64_03685 [Alphaproteobacteria bacterium]|nr:hypothetical protein [Alphaproteobacteria bacterium]